MAVTAAINISEREAKYVLGSVLPSGNLKIHDTFSIELPANWQITESEDDSEEAEVETNNSQNSTVDITPLRDAVYWLRDFEERTELDVDSVVVLLPSNEVLFQHLELPFREQKMLEQVVPAQLQDLLPFDVEKFVLDNVVVGDGEEGSYSIIASLVPADEVQATLAMAKRLGLDPKILSSKAAAIAALPRLFPDAFPEQAFALLLVDQKRSALAVFIDHQLRHIREIRLDESVSSLQGFYTTLACSVMSVERESRVLIERVYLLGVEDVAPSIAKMLRVPAIPLDLARYVEKDHRVRERTADLSWAFGLIASDQQEKKASFPFHSGNDDKLLFNFRQGRFAYKPSIRNFLMALEDEIAFITLALLFGITWAIVNVVASHKMLAKVESAIETQVNRVVANAPYRSEPEHVRNELSRLEEQLRGLGSLSSLSPLDSLKTLSVSVGSALDLTLDDINIGYSNLKFTGTVNGIPAVGKLDSILKGQKGRFCDVKVEPRGKVPGSSRVRFSAEASFCS